MSTRVTRGMFWRCAVAAGLCCGALQGVQAAESANCDAASATQVRLQVQVSGLRNAKGELAITIYPDDSKRFLAKGGKLMRLRVPAVLPVTTACFVLPKVSQYAVSVYHDANADHDFNRTFVGLPAEGFGFSRNPKSLVGLPSLAEVRVPTILGDNLAAIQLTYP